MRRLELIAGGLAVAVACTGCASFENREWDGCAIAGAVVGAAAGGITGGVLANNADGADNATRGGAIGGGIVGGAAIGAVLGHLICDPVKEEPKPPPPPPPPPSGTKISELPGANFDFNKWTIKPEGKVKLDEAVALMNKYPDMHVDVNGYTDWIGSDAYNMKLSQRRAESVVEYLTSKGIAASRLTAKGFGKSNPVADNKTAEGRAKNRRVELIVH
jgi:outer membrane protein OmpA-like peptidoglycan-associated protein